MEQDERLLETEHASVASESTDGEKGKEGTTMMVMMEEREEGKKVGCGKMMEIGAGDGDGQGRVECNCRRGLAAAMTPKCEIDGKGETGDWEGCVRIGVGIDGETHVFVSIGKRE